MNQHQKKELSLRQTPLTCETGPGNPSGHVMINVVTCLAVFSLISDQLQSYDLRMGLVVRRMLKNLLFVWLAIMCTSRVYILAHFPHQCALAICIGYICFHWSKSKLNSWTRQFHHCSHFCHHNGFCWVDNFRRCIESRNLKILFQLLSRIVFGKHFLF